MKITYDEEADALYITFSKKTVEKTKGDYPVHIDYSSKDKLVGIEILEATKLIEVKVLEEIKKT